MKEKRTIGLINGNGSPIIAVSTERNARCKCGSGKKAKHCCGANTRYFASQSDELLKAKLAAKKEKLAV